MVDQEVVRAELVRRCRQRGATSALAEQWGVSRPYLSMLKNGDKHITEKVARRLGFRKRVIWERIDAS